MGRRKGEGDEAGASRSLWTRQAVEKSAGVASLLLWAPSRDKARSRTTTRTREMRVRDSFFFFSFLKLIIYF